jgi:hypothetical protein
LAKIAAKSGRVWLDEFDFSGFLTSLDMNLNQATPEVTCLSDTGPRRVVDNYDHSHSHSGFFDGADNSFDEQIFAMLDDSDHYLAQCFAGETEGNPCYEAIVKLSSQPRQAQSGQAIALNIESQGSGGLARGHILRKNTALTGNGNGTGYNTGATTLNQVYAVTIRCFSFTGTTFNVKIQQSTDDGAGDAYADIATLAQDVTAAGVWRLTTTAATEAWKRVVISSWNGTTASIAVTAGVVAGT